ncbi:mucin-3A-like [Dendropsophus ebraccatus]|uniref:mucin-3A-like n=1 Tax=Dendropsophus ebraccatus TaxID=150705 RepID=UPI0038321D93
MKKQNPPVSQTIMILEERKVTYSKILRKPRLNRNIDLYAEIGSGDLGFSTPGPPLQTTSIPEGSGDGFTTSEGSGDMPPSSVEPKPTPTNPNPPLQCQNGGRFNGEICVCAANFYGDRCEFISGRIELGPQVNVTVNVELRFVNKIYNVNFQDILSLNYRDFETNFKKEMALLYKNVPGYKDVKILDIRNGSVIVNHNVIAEVEYIMDVDLNEMYDIVFQRVETQLENLQTENCTGGTFPLCVNGASYKIARDPVPTMEELCRNLIPDSFENFFSPSLTQSGLTCLSDCEERSPNHRNCHDGICRILPNTGASCSCPNTDQYIYASGDCKGKMAKTALFGGLGAAIGVLVIGLLIMGFFQLRRWRRIKREVSRERFNADPDSVWEDENSSIDFTGIQNNQQDTGSSSSGSAERTFRPTLDKIDPSLKIKTKRPTVSLT